MGESITRDELQALANTKIDDAKLLIANKRFSNAYYLAGYAVECGLKACIAARMTKEAIPDKSFINSVYCHEPKKLVGLAGLSRELQDETSRDIEFAANWAIVAEWSEAARYKTHDPISAQSLVNAIDAKKSGVLEWIQRFW